MVKRRNLAPEPHMAMADLIAKLSDAAGAKNTQPSGVKDLGTSGDVLWTRPDGTTQTARDMDLGLDAAQGRIDEAELELQQARQDVADAKAEAEAAQDRLNELDETTLPAVRDELEAQAEAAQQEFRELDDRLADFGTDPALDGLRGELQDARDVADSASASASAANDAASAASQAALEAAGIAASKGRVIIQDTEPQGEDRQAANIWIKPVEDDPDTEVEERAVTYVYLEASDEWIPTTSDELAQAAQNALDAREAAQQAQQRADTAVSNAATAQSAAEAAQRTADEATTDARDAHNEAVAAQAAADAAIARGDNLILNGSFELDTPAWSQAEGRYGIIEHEDAHTGTRVMRLSPASANAYPMSENFSVRVGQLIHVQMWYHYFPNDRGSRLAIYFRQDDKNGGQVDSGYAEDGDGNSIWLYADDLVEGEWTLFEGVIPIAEGATHLRVGPHAVSSSTDIFHIDDLLAIDVTEVRKAQARADEAYAEAASKLDEDEIDAKVAASANGKNSITRAVTEPTADGVVAGDLWVRVDADQNAYAQWYWNNSRWVPAQIRNEMMESLDVHKLQVTGSAEMDEAVIDKLWVDGLVGKTAAFNRLTVAPENMIPDPHGRDPEITAHRDYFSSGWSMSTAGYWRKTSDTEGNNAIRLDTGETRVTSEVTPGQRYALSYDVWLDAGTADCRYAIRGVRMDGSTFYVGDSTEAGGDESSYTPVAAGGWVTVNRYWDAQSDAVTASFDVQVNRVEGATDIRVRNPVVRPAVGGVLIEDGAISAPHITFTEELSGEVARFMDTESKKLVVTEEAILNHTTLLGTTVVEQINVQDKLIGTDGVFTGTVDFANVNVTGELLANEISGKSLSGVTVTGSTVRTAITSGNYAELTSDARWSRPGLAFRLSGFNEPASLTVRAPSEDSAGDELTGSITLASAYDSNSGDGVSHVSAAPNRAWLQGSGYYVEAGPNSAKLWSAQSASVNDGNLAYVEVREHEAIMGYRTDYDSGMGGIRQRVIVSDDETVKLKGWVNDTDATPLYYREHDLFTLFEPDWETLELWSSFEPAPGTAAPLSITKMGNRVHLRGRIQRKSGDFQVGTAYHITTMASGWRPEYTERQLIATGPSSGVARIESGSDGTMTVAPITGSAGWIDLSGVFYDLPYDY